MGTILLCVDEHQSLKNHPGFESCGLKKHLRGAGDTGHSTGEDANIFGNPWSIAIVLPIENGSNDTRVHCSGSILSEKFALSAAHCFVTDDFKRMKIVAGNSDPTKKRKKISRFEQVTEISGVR